MPTSEKTPEEVIAAIEHATQNAAAFLCHVRYEYHRTTRLQTLATLYAALHAAPRAKGKDNSVEAIANDAAEILAALERRLP